MRSIQFDSLSQNVKKRFHGEKNVESKKIERVTKIPRFKILHPVFRSPKKSLPKIDMLQLPKSLIKQSSYKKKSKIMLSSSILRCSSRKHYCRLLSTTSTPSTPFGNSNNKVSPIADDGRHELWREGQSSDHDNEPRYVVRTGNRIVYKLYLYRPSVRPISAETKFKEKTLKLQNECFRCIKL
jgi:hypothetical protein